MLPFSTKEHQFSSFGMEDHVTDKKVCAKIQQALGPHEDLLTIITRGKLKWYEHVCRSSGLA